MEGASGKWREHRENEMEPQNQGKLFSSLSQTSDQGVGRGLVTSKGYYIIKTLAYFLTLLSNFLKKQTKVSM